MLFCVDSFVFSVSDTFVDDVLQMYSVLQQKVQITYRSPQRIISFTDIFLMLIRFAVIVQQQGKSCLSSPHVYSPSRQRAAQKNPSQ